MKIPDKVKIGNLYFDVGYSENIARDRKSLGESSGNGLWIKIDKTIPKQLQDSTFLHEIIEMINFVYNLDLDHHNICLLETSLSQVLLDNPCMFKED